MAAGGAAGSGPACMGGAAVPRQQLAQSSLWELMFREQQKLAHEAAAMAKATSPDQASAAISEVVEATLAQLAGSGRPGQTQVRARLSVVEATFAQ